MLCKPRLLTSDILDTNHTLHQSDHPPSSNDGGGVGSSVCLGEPNQLKGWDFFSLLNLYEYELVWRGTLNVF